MEECGGRGVDGACEEHQAFGEYVRRKPRRCSLTRSIARKAEDAPKDCVSINTCMLKIDAGCSIGAYNDLKLDIDTENIQYRVITHNTELPTLSYHLFVHVPTCSPPSRLYVPHKKLLHRSPTFSGVVSSRHTTKRASSTISRQEALFLSLARIVRSWDQIFRFSVERTPIAPRATWARQ